MSTSLPRQADVASLSPVMAVPWRRQSPHVSLPATVDALFGRDQDLAALAVALRARASRLLVLTGPGGVGKTRLAIASATDAAASFNDGVIFVALAPIRDAALVAGTIARAAGLREAGGQPASVRLAEALADRDLLLVLDNFEHLLPAGTLVSELLAACPRLTILITTRTRPRLTGERDIPVQPLTLPLPPRPAPGGSCHQPASAPEASDVDIGAIGHSPAVRLFADRARAIDPSFRLVKQNALAVAEICRRVDGLPLAIELAAARIQVLSPAALLARLEARLPLLADGPRDQPERLRTMRQAIAWSHDLLPAEVQATFRCLAVFVGGFSLDAAQAVCAAPFEQIAALVDQSLLQRVPSPGEPRFAMLETIREFGVEQLAVSTEKQAALAAHAVHYLALSEEAAGGLQQAGRGTWLARLEIEWPNLRGALEHFEQMAEWSASLRMAGALWRFWYQHGAPAEGLAHLELVLTETAAEADPASRAQALLGAGVLAWQRAEYQRSEAWLEAALQLHRTLGDAMGTAWTLNYLACLVSDQRLDDRSEGYHQESLRIFRDIGDPVGMAQAAGNLGELALEEDRYDVAIDRLRAALLSQREIGDAAGAARVMTYLGHALVARGDLAGAAEALAEALTTSRDVAFVQILPDVLRGIAALVAARGEREEAARLYGAEHALRTTLGVLLPPVLRARHDASIAAVRGLLPEQAFRTAWASGRALSLDEAIAIAAPVATRDALQNGLRTRPNRAAGHGLTPREVEVLALLVAGQSDPQIGAALSISARTVESHVAAILAKLAQPSRTAAVAHAVRHGLV